MRKDIIATGIMLVALAVATVCYAAIGNVSVYTNLCLSGTAPTQAAADGLTCLFHYDPFTSTSGVDVNNTLAAGYKNYVQNWYEMRVTPAADFSSDGTALTISDSPAAGLAMESAAPQQTSAPISTFVGTFFQAPFYYQAQIAVNQALAPGTQKLDTCGIGGGQVMRVSWPLVWFMGKDEVVAQTNGGNPPTDQPEVDVIEFSEACNSTTAGAWAPQTNIHYWGASSGYQPGCTGGPTLNANWDATTFHTIGFEVLRMADNGGTGVARFYTSDTGSTPFMTCTWTSNTSGVGSVETQQMMRMVNPGFNWPIVIKNEQFWGLPR